jgi:glycosyltransferase involved in cell wall biosynthesis
MNDPLDLSDASRLPRVAVIMPILGVPSEVWADRQLRGFTRIEPVLMGWTTDPAWRGGSGIEVRMIPGQFNIARSFLRRVLRRVGRAEALSMPAPQRKIIRDAIEAADVQAVLCHFAWTAINVSQALSSSLPLLVHVHGRDVSAMLADPAYRAMLSRQLRRASALIAVGQHQLDLLKPNGIPRRTAVIPCGAPLELFAQGAPPRQEAGGPLCFISIGRVAPEKGMFETLCAFEQIAAEFPQAELVLIGYGPDLEALRQRAAASPFAARIRLTGCLTPEEIALELAQAQIYLQHSRSVAGWVEGFGVTLTEAGAAGLPLLASAMGGLVDQIEDGVNGFLFPPDDIAAQAARMRQLAADPGLRARMGAEARRLAARFDATAMIRALEQEILDAIGAKGSRQ